MATWEKVRKRQLYLIHTTCEILGHILKNISEKQAHELQDGPEGWTIIEIVCHLRDFDEIFYQRAQMMLAEDYPQLPAYDHDAMAKERNYQGEALAYAYYDLRESRQRFVEFFQSLSEEQWEVSGVHPEKGHFTMTDALMQVSNHDVNHLEQITRVLEQEYPASGIIPDIEFRKGEN